MNASSIPTSSAPQQPESTRGAPAGERHQRPAAAVVRQPLRPRAADVGVRPVPPRSRGAQQRPLPGLRPVLGPALVRKLRREAGGSHTVGLSRPGPVLSDVLGLLGLLGLVTCSAWPVSAWVLASAWSLAWFVVLMLVASDRREHRAARNLAARFSAIGRRAYY